MQRAGRPFFIHRWVQQNPMHARMFNDVIYMLLALSFLTIGAYFIFSMWRDTEAHFNAVIMLPFFALLVFANLSTVIAAYPAPDNLSFNTQTKWPNFAVTLYPFATWAGLASTLVMLAAYVMYLLSGGEVQRGAAIAWAAGLLLSTPTLMYRMFFIRTLIPWEDKTKKTDIAP
jgi:hypothetical protein